MSFITYPNQRTFIIKRQKVNSQKPFLSVQIDSITAAMKKLNGVPFKLYVYLLCNKDGFELGFSPQHFANESNVSLKSAKEAVGELIKEGFLTAIEGHNNHYYFNEVISSASTVKVSLKTKKKEEPIYALFEIDDNEVYYTKEELTAIVGKTQADDYWNQSTSADGTFKKDDNGRYIKIERGEE